MVRRRRGAAALLAGMALSGCELGSTTIPLSEPQIVVHAVLNPTSSSQTILLEESITGKPTDEYAFDPANPIVTSRGIPISGAIVQLTGAGGTTRTATEQKLGSNPTGVYTIAGSVQPGVRYTLHISALGRTVTGSTTVPQALPPPGTFLYPFNRDSQSVTMPIRDVAFARAYWVRIEAPVSAFSVLTTDQEVAISGDTRNLFTDDLLRVFFPGFLQGVTVAAVDTNLYDYYRSANDPFSGTGLINRLDGAVGLFGSIAIIDRRILDVTKDSTEWFEGTYTLRGGSDGLPHTIRMYLESKPNDEGRGRVSGAWFAGSNITPARGGMYGAFVSDSVELLIYEPGSTSHSVGIFNARIRNDSIFARISSSSPDGTLVDNVLYVRQGK